MMCARAVGLCRILAGRLGLVVCLAAGLTSASAWAQLPPQDAAGTAIPAPPTQHEDGATETHRGLQDESNPTRAYDPATGQNMFWDRKAQTWVDSRTGKPVPGGFSGRRAGKACPPPRIAAAPPGSSRLGPTEKLASKASLATALDSAVLDELNFARTRPGEFAQTLRGDAGATAFLRAQMPISPLIWNDALAAAAARHAGDAGPNGLTAHVGTDGSTVGQRIRSERIVAGVVAEGISLGQSSAAGVVGQLVIDQGLPNHPHRGDIFDPMLTVAGVGCGPHKLYHWMCVIDYAGAVMTGATPPPPPPPVAKNDCWIDAATGYQVSTGPPGWSPTGAGGTPGENPDANHVEHGGHTFVRLPDGTWIDAATGHQVSTGPPGWSPTGAGGEPGENPDPNHVEHGAHTFVRVPCP